MRDEDRELDKNNLAYLSQEQKATTRPIWESIFKEDTPKFLDYYYDYYCCYDKSSKNNLILCKYSDDSSDNIISMLHLNSYRVSLNKNIFDINYIVAVATLEKHRKKGYMSQLLINSFNQMYNQKMPFTFLRPAKDEIYLPFGFTYIYNHKLLELVNSDELIFEDINFENLKDFDLLAGLTNNYFINNYYSTYCVRNREYMLTLLHEVKSENGRITKMYEGSISEDNLIGYYVFWGDYIRAIFLNSKSKFDSYTRVKSSKPLVMGRVINVVSFLESLTLKDEYLNFDSDSENIKINIKVLDNIIKKNNCFLELNINSFNFQKAEVITIYNDLGHKEFDLVLNISDLTSLFFGYTQIESYTQDLKVIQDFKKIKIFSKVFIDEEV